MRHALQRCPGDAPLSVGGLSGNHNLDYQGLGAEKAALDEAYNIHSKKVLVDAKKALGLKANNHKYTDCLMMIFGNSTKLFRKLKNDPKEIVAYAIDYEACGRSNDLSKAIVERFGKCLEEAPRDSGKRRSA